MFSTRIYPLSPSIEGIEPTSASPNSWPVNRVVFWKSPPNSTYTRTPSRFDEKCETRKLLYGAPIGEMGDRGGVLSATHSHLASHEGLGPMPNDLGLPSTQRPTTSRVKPMALFPAGLLDLADDLQDCPPMPRPCVDD